MDSDLTTEQPRTNQSEQAHSRSEQLRVEQLKAERFHIKQMATVNGSDQPGAPTNARRPLSTIAAGIARDSRFLAEQEILLVKTEAKETAVGAGKGLAMLLAGSSILTASLVCLLAAAVMALRGYLPLWAATLAVGVAATLVAVGIMRWGITKFTSGLLGDSQIMDQLDRDEGAAATAHDRNKDSQRDQNGAPR